jgi:hypothetical protein
MGKLYSPLTEVFGTPQSFNVVESVSRQRDDGTSRFVVKLRATTPSEANGLKTEGSQITLYVSVLEDVSGSITIDPALWDFSLSEFALPETGEIINLKWLRVSR